MTTIKNASASSILYLTSDGSKLGPNGQLPEYNSNQHPFLGELAAGKQVTMNATNGIYVWFFKDNAPAAAKPRWPGSGEMIWKVRLRKNDDLVVNPDTKETSIRGQDRNMLDTFDHVVVLMLENRSFDNLLGYMYPEGVPKDAPLGKTFNGLLGKDEFGQEKTFSNYLPPGDDRPNGLRIPVSPVEPGNYFQPYPDPGETYDHVMVQLFNGISRVDTLTSNNAHSLPLPTPMEGFVADYIKTFKTDMGRSPNKEEYQQIMQCYPTQSVPILTTLAENFGVFDRWFCAVPSQTWCNRAFWNAGTSWGFVTNSDKNADDLDRWQMLNRSDTIFNQIQESSVSSLTWKVYVPNWHFLHATTWLKSSLTLWVHYSALKDFWNAAGDDHFPYMQSFFSDCAAGTLPSYAFVEPRFLTPNNDMHPASANEYLFEKGPVGSVKLGEELVRKVYEAIRLSPKRDKTLLIITFDEHGGCYDHVAPPGFGRWSDGRGGSFFLDPNAVTPPDLTNCLLQDDFDFRLLGVRVPMIMVSSHIAKNTVVNSPMDHCSFLNTVGKKWGLPQLTARVREALEFTEVFTLTEPRELSSWPVLDTPVVERDEVDVSGYPVNDLVMSMLRAASALPKAVQAKQRGALPDLASVATVGEALEYLKALHDLGVV